ncbi:ParB/RepB/Spo0J family partition protein [Sphingobium sp. SA2]|jgi:ParB family transcriptional regulator, chromosome partitioning protein|uniref:ParB/RepB/Spo0J family partition protein n=1 Tax=Sphingobium sp. SA2 TaxID=1524832 RepID=UPI0028C2E9F7|nr:ParB/RepB/Spo0J family partition protein [Sphingobium sp. SA2]MDT7533174.1 ParB/RepB/Spo0J family partition protein [Sphingobium sp. SA2]|tara:strand:- start:210 stop:1985 length:1776 start_codon:yes stop_codon:yes gene_type:complete
MTIQNIALNKLALSDLNVRKVKPKEIEALAADIQARGVLQNLIGYDEDGKIKICAGGRRYRALKLLQKAKTIPANFEVPVDLRNKDDALEISLAENAQREAMHPADAIMAYRAIIDSGKEVDDVAASFGVSPAYVRRVLKLAALHPTILKAFQKDEIGMGAAQAFALTDDQTRQLEVFKRTGDNAHQIRAMLTQEKMADNDKHFRIAGEEAYVAAGGTFTADLFGERRYCDDAGLVMDLVQDRLEAVAKAARDDGWRDAEAQLSRPDSFWMRSHLEPAGKRDPSDDEQDQLAQIEAAIQKRQSEIDEDEYDYDDDLRALTRKHDAIASGCRVFTAEQKADHTLILFIGHDGIEQVAFTRSAKGGAADGPKPPRPDYSQKVMDQLGAIRTMAVREVIATDPELALDVLLTGLLGQVRGGVYSWQQAAEIKAEQNAFHVDETIMAHSVMRDIDEIAQADLDRVAESPALDDMRQLDTETKLRLLAYCVASQITSLSFHTDRDQQLAQIASAAQIDMADKWEPNQPFYDQLSKATLLKLLDEGCGTEAATNCQTMKRGDLAVTVNERLAGRRILPPALRSSALPDTDESASEAA